MISIAPADVGGAGDVVAVGLATLRMLAATRPLSRLYVVDGPPLAGRTTWADVAEVPGAAAWLGPAGPRERRAILDATAALGVPTRAVAIRAPLCVCAWRNALRHDRVPEWTLAQQWRDAMATPPSTAEGFDRVIEYVVRADYRTTEELARKRGQTFYRWRTRQDSRVRAEHRARHGRLFSWLYPPDGGHPGEDYGCRCWAESVSDDDVVETIGGDLRARPLTIPRWARQR